MQINLGKAIFRVLRKRAALDPSDIGADHTLSVIVWA
jgi:hypothetical protein